MLKFIAKIKKHGLKRSYLIIRQKTRVIFQELIIKSGRYNFNHKNDLLNETGFKFINFLENYRTGGIGDISLNENDDSTLKNNFYLLGKNYAFGEKINWHFNSDDLHKSYPVAYSGRINIADYKSFGDYRVTWELNRHHHFVWYAQNYFLTGNEKYAELFLSQLKDWISVNKPGYGINFVSPMEISVRLINWAAALLIFQKKKKRKITLDFGVINSILGQLLYLNDNLFIKTRKFRNNHSIVELAALILFQSIIKWEKIPNTDQLYSWLFRELEQQFYNDGINFEHSPAYSRFTIESLLIILMFVRGTEVEKQNEKLFKLVDKYSSALRKFLTPADSVPLFSDSDNGRILFLSGSSRDFNDFKGFFDFCGIFFNNDSYLISDSAGEFNTEAKWWSFLAGKKNEHADSAFKKYGTSFFPDGGYYIYRDEEVFLVFKSGYPGNKNLKEEYAPHAHNDLLSFELFINKEPLFIDSGTYTYNLFDNDFRSYFRSVYAHNTVIIGGKNQFEHYEAFGARSFPEVNCSIIDEKKVQGEICFHDNIRIKREIEISSKKIEFNDTITGLYTESKVEINLNFHPSVDSVNINKKVVEAESGKAKYFVNLIPDNNIDFEIKNSEGWVSDYYNCKLENKKVIFSFPRVKDEIKIKWFIVWQVI